MSVLAQDYEGEIDDFAAQYRAGRPQLVWRRVVADLETPVSAMLKLAPGRPYSFLFESVEGGTTLGRYSIIGLSPDLVWRCKDGRAEINREASRHPHGPFAPVTGAAIDSLRALIAESRIEPHPGLPPMASGLFGYLGYDMVKLVERLPSSKPDTLAVPDAVMVRPGIVLVFDMIERDIRIITSVWPKPDLSPEAAEAAARERIDEVMAALSKSLPATPVFSPMTRRNDIPAPVSNTGKAEYCATVDRVKDYIRAGDAYQVVPSHRMSAPFAHSPLTLYRALRRLNPSPFLFLLDLDGFSVVGSSPEILVRLRDGEVTIRPLAGTRRRGQTVEEDNALAAELLADPKEISEHLMLLDLGRNDVGRVSEIGTVAVTQRMVIERYSHVMHIVSNVTGRLKAGLDALDALFAGFPAGTVSGAPKIRAMEIIDELEVSRRGVYGGAVGYFGSDGTLDTCIALRTAVLKDGMLHVQAGGGVVADSNPLAEYQETVAKSAALFDAAEQAQSFADNDKIMLLLIDNYDSFTYNLVQFLGDLGADTRVIRNDAVTAEDALKQGADAIILSPGPCDPDQAGICLELIRLAAARRVPLLGVCLGHQAIGQAFGGKVIRAPAPMHGKVSAIEHDGSGVFMGVPSPFDAARYHSLVVEAATLPASLRVNAKTRDGIIMGLAHRELPIHGVQFHPESIASEHGHDLLKNFLELAGARLAA